MSTPLRDVNNYTGAQTDAVIRAVAGGSFLRLCAVEIVVSNACTVNVDAKLEWDDAADIPALRFDGIPPGGGIVAIVNHMGGDGMDLLYTGTVPTGGSVTVNTTSIGW